VAALVEAGDIMATTAINVDEIVRGLRPTEDGSATELFAGLEVLPSMPQPLGRPATGVEVSPCGA